MSLLLGAGGEEVDGFLIDLSQGGILVEVLGQHLTDRALHLRFVVRPDEVCSARGHVIRQDDRHVAIQFTEIDDAFRDFTEQLAASSDGDRRGFLENMLEPDIQILLE